MQDEEVMQRNAMVGVSFGALAKPDHPITEQEIVAWLSGAKGIEIELGVEDPISVNPTYSAVIKDFEPDSYFSIYNLDPGTAAVLIAGLSAILA